MPASEMAPPPLAITLFGSLQVRVDGRPLPPFRSRKPLWLLALLTLRHNRPVEREWLAGTLWPEVEQSNAFANLRPVLSVLHKALARLHIATSLEDFAGLAWRQGHSVRAVRLLGAAEAQCTTLKHTGPAAIAAEHERTIVTARAALSAEAFAAAWEEGRAMTLEQAVAYALQNAPADLF